MNKIVAVGSVTWSPKRRPYTVTSMCRSVAHYLTRCPIGHARTSDSIEPQSLNNGLMLLYGPEYMLWPRTVTRSGDDCAKGYLATEIQRRKQCVGD